MRNVILLALGLIAGASFVAQADVQTAWRVDFDDVSKVGGVMYLQRGGARDSNGLIAKVSDGAITFGADHDQSATPWDRAVLAWGKCMPSGFWQWPESEFKPIDVQQYPVIEIRARLAPGMDPNMCLTPVFETPSGVSFT